MCNCRCNRCSRRCPNTRNNLRCSRCMNNDVNMNNSNNDIYENSFSQDGAFPSNYLYGHAYTPVQTMCNTYTPEVGLQNGTIFPELVSPYCPGQSMDFIDYLRNGGM